MNSTPGNSMQIVSPTVCDPQPLSTTTKCVNHQVCSNTTTKDATLGNCSNNGKIKAGEKRTVTLILALLLSHRRTKLARAPHTDLYSREGAFVFLKWLVDQHVSFQFVLAVECRLAH